MQQKSQSIVFQSVALVLLLVISGCAKKPEMLLSTVENPQTEASSHLAFTNKEDPSKNNETTLQSKPCDATVLPGSWMLTTLSSNLPDRIKGSFFSPFQFLYFDEAGDMKMIAGEEQPKTESIVFSLEVLKTMPSAYAFSMNNDGYFEISSAEDNSLLLPGNCSVVTADTQTTGANNETVALEKGQLLMRTVKVKPDKTMMLMRVFSRVGLPDASQLDIKSLPVKSDQEKMASEKPAKEKAAE